MEEQKSNFKHKDDIIKNIEIKNFFNNNNFSLLKEVDKIINKSKIQLGKIKSKQNNDNQFYQCNKILNNDIGNKNNISFFKKKSYSSKKEIIENLKINNYKNNNNINKDFEFERLNLKLGSDLAMERAKVRELILKLEIKDKEISSLKRQLIYTQLNFYNKQREYENLLTKNEKKKPKDFENYYLNKYSISDKNPNIIKAFFNYFNKHLELFNELKIINNHKILIYNEKDLNNNNIKNSKLVIDTLELLIEKLITKKKELFGPNLLYKHNRNDIINISEEKGIEIIDFQNNDKLKKASNVEVINKNTSKNAQNMGKK